MSKILSLCSGYGGLDLAVEEHFTGSHTAYWSDIDPSACAVMEARFPDAEPVGDLTELGDKKFDISILTAGYPCQPFSHANQHPGGRQGEDDERHLWPYIANTISVSRPQWVVLENVPGHANLGGPTVVASLASMGYSNIRWGVVSASAAGAPHQRRRWFCVATNTNRPRLEGQRTQHELREASEETDTPWGRYVRAVRRWEHILGRDAPSPVADGNMNPSFVEWMQGLDENWVCGVVPSRSKALRLLGNGVVKQQARLALELICDD